MRVLLVDDEDRVLLLSLVPPETGRPRWFPPGGGLEDGEDARVAAAREVAEETGLRTLSLGPEVWRRRNVFSWRGLEFDQRERWFIARVASFEPIRDGWTSDEQADLADCRWWTLRELEETTDELVPRDLPAHLRSLLADGPPPAPIEIGE